MVPKSKHFNKLPTRATNTLDLTCSQFGDIVSRMKTTIDISDPLFLQAKRLAAEHSTTLKEIVETALRRFFEQEKTRVSNFKLREASVEGNGVQPGVQEGDWAEIRRLLYEGRGG